MVSCTQQNRADKSRSVYLLRVSHKHPSFSLFSQRLSGGAGVESSCAREAGEEGKRSMCGL